MGLCLGMSIWCVFMAFAVGMKDLSRFHYWLITANTWSAAAAIIGALK